MELFVATWSLRFAVIAALVVVGLSVSSGSDVLEAVQRAVLAVFVFTLGGRLLVGWLEAPERRLARLQARAAKRAAKGGGGGGGGGGKAAAAAGTKASGKKAAA